MPEAPKPSNAAPNAEQPISGQLAKRLLGKCTFPSAGTSVVIGVSGGPDSLALLVLAAEAGLKVTAVHVDHGLRPDSANEAERVREAAQRFGAQFRAEAVQVEPGSNLEERARLARHQALGPDAMTGHTADDQAETLVVNLMRGAGPRGLASIEAGYRHPILGLRRSETVALCDEFGLEPFVDPTNTDPRFVRNRVRHDVLPLLNDVSGRDVVPLLVRTAATARSTVADIDVLAAQVDVTDSRALQKLVPSVAKAALGRWLRDDLGHPPSAAELDRAMAVVNHEIIATELRGGRRLSRTDGRLIVSGPSRSD